MTRIEGIAKLLAEHHSRQGMVGPEHKCAKCGVWYESAAALASHQAAVVDAWMEWGER